MRQTGQRPMQPRGGGVERGTRRRRARFGRVLVGGVLILALMVGVKAARNWPDTVAVPPLAERLAALATAAAPGPDGGFFVADPYAVPGQWYKVQLHVHTDRSLDGRWSVAEALDAYAAAGYDFVAISDHDTITRPEAVPPGLVVIPAEENTVAFPFWPLGRHAVLLFVQEHIDHGSARERFDAALAQGAVISVAHPNWHGNLGSGVWEMRHLLAAPQFTLMEVWNPHSDTRLDTAAWHEVAVRRGPEAPVWAVAVDDSHYPAQLGAAWTMVKAEARTLPALKEALLRGSLYPTTGPLVEFGVVEGAVTVAAAGTPGSRGTSLVVEFIAASGDVVAVHDGPLPASYTPRGDEGFIRVEVSDPSTGGRAWSQPFWIVADGAGGPL